MGRAGGVGGALCGQPGPPDWKLIETGRGMIKKEESSGRNLRHGNRLDTEAGKQSRALSDESHSSINKSLKAAEVASEREREGARERRQ